MTRDDPGGIDRDAWEKQERDVRTLLIGSHAVAVITERDISDAVARGRSPDTPVSVVAHPLPGVRVIPPDVSLLEAARLMLSSELGVVVWARDHDEGGPPERLSLRRG